MCLCDIEKLFEGYFWLEKWWRFSLSKTAIKGWFFQIENRSKKKNTEGFCRNKVTVNVFRRPPLQKFVFLKIVIFLKRVWMSFMVKFSLFNTSGKESRNSFTCQNWRFLKIWLKMKIFENLAKFEDFSNLGKIEDFLKFGENWRYLKIW